MLQSCLESGFSSVSDQTLSSFLSILAIIPKSCRRTQLANLSQFPILQVLQLAHTSPSLKIKAKFPAIVSGWLDIFNNEQVQQLVEALLTYVEDGAKGQSQGMQILLYSCYSINRIVLLRGQAVDSGYLLQKIFPVAILVFNQTDNP